MGHALEFREALVRKQLAPSPFPGASGPHRGIQPANLEYDLYLACAGPDGINVAAYVALHTTLDLAAVYDLLEMQQVHSTWAEAARENAKVASGQASGPRAVARAGAKSRIGHR